MAQEKIIIKFKPEGHAKLIAAIKALDNSTKKLMGTQKSHVAVQKKSNNQTMLGVKNNRLLGGSFATLRSHLLLYSFAMSLGIRQMVQFGKQAAVMESVANAFNSLQGGTEKASLAMTKLSAAVGGTMSEMDLLKQANNAMILGITKNADEMSEMFNVAKKLGRALGVETKSAVESLITGIGRQSRLMLDNIGIIVRVEEANQKYADQLNLTVGELTDVQKKQAFFNETMTSARKKILGLGEALKTAQDSYERFGSALEDSTTRVGGVLNDLFAPIMDHISKSLEKRIPFSSAIASESFDVLQRAIEHTSFDLQSAEIMMNTYGVSMGALGGKDIPLLKEQLKLLNARISEVAVSTEVATGAFDEIAVSTELGFHSIGFLDEAYKNTKQGQIDFLQAQVDLGVAMADAAPITIQQAEALDYLQQKLEELKAKGFTPLSAEEKNLVSFGKSIAGTFKSAALSADNMGDAFVKAFRAIAIEIAAQAATFAFISMLVPSVGAGGFMKFAFGHTGGLIKDDGSVHNFSGINNRNVVCATG